MRGARTGKSRLMTSLLVLSCLLPGARLPSAKPTPSLPYPSLEPVVASLSDLRNRLRIPGLAAAIVIDGEVAWRGHWGNLTTTTPREIASVTKTMAAVVALQEVAQGQLELQDAVAGLPGVQVRHLLSHTSVGRPGESFLYNNARYGILTSILERSSQQQFSELLASRILSPSGMHSSRPGSSSASGVVSNVEDLTRYMAALDGDEMLGEREKQWMWMPISPGLPYALGWFSQSYAGRRVVWHYGQLNGYGSSLVVKIPALRANLVVLSNSSLLSDANHLESGDITRSPLGRSFLAALVDHLPELSPFTGNGSAAISATNHSFSPTAKRPIVHGSGL